MTSPSRKNKKRDTQEFLRGRSLGINLCTMYIICPQFRDSCPESRISSKKKPSSSLLIGIPCVWHEMSTYRTMQDRLHKLVTVGDGWRYDMSFTETKTESVIKEKISQPNGVKSNISYYKLQYCGSGSACFCPVRIRICINFLDNSK